MAYLWASFLLLCLGIALAPRTVTQALLACTWVGMALLAVGSILYEIVRRL